MDEKNPISEAENQTASTPAEDVKRVRTWLNEYGRPALTVLAIAVVVLLGISVWRNQKESKAAAAAQALFTAQTPEEFQQLALQNASGPTAPLAQLTAGTEFYAQNRFDEALAAYQQFLVAYPDHPLAGDARVGAAASLEALGEYESAAAAYQDFASANRESPLYPQAVMGAARCLEQLHRFDDARILYEDFMADHPDSRWLPQAESGLLFLKKAERAAAASVLPDPVFLSGSLPVVQEQTILMELEPSDAEEGVDGAVVEGEAIEEVSTDAEAVAEIDVPAASE
ncbi:MAG: tetratricopeptide repeat protein [Verrucomicrobiota bacterium]|jgi:TolA-binding protein|nr:tetratricopeptide repeat protein [Verrucomicrobiota bacterium]